MENRKCMNCGAENPEHNIRFLTMNVSSSSSTARINYKTTQTTTVTTEQFGGAERYVVCDQCIRKKRISNAIGMFILGIFQGFLASILLFGMIDFFSKGFFNSHLSLILWVGVIGAIAASVINAVKAMQEKTDFVAQRMLKKMKGDPMSGKVYVPASREAYCSGKTAGADINVFHQKFGLKTGVSDMLFLQVIATGQGERTVDEILAQKKEPVAKEEKPDVTIS